MTSIMNPFHSSGKTGSKKKKIANALLSISWRSALKILFLYLQFLLFRNLPEVHGFRTSITKLSDSRKRLVISIIVSENMMSTPSLSSISGGSEGCRRRPPPPNGTQFFRFHIRFCQKTSRQRSAHPPPHHHHQREILGLQLIMTIMIYFKG